MTIAACVFGMSSNSNPPHLFRSGLSVHVIGNCLGHQSLGIKEMRSAVMAVVMVAEVPFAACDAQNLGKDGRGMWKLHLQGSITT